VGTAAWVALANSLFIMLQNANQLLLPGLVTICHRKRIQIEVIVNWSLSRSSEFRPFVAHFIGHLIENGRISMKCAIRWDFHSGCGFSLGTLGLIV
jgi:hypothetical protein